MQTSHISNATHRRFLTFIITHITKRDT